MFRIYSALLREIEKRDYDVFSRRIRVSSPRKLAIAWTSLFGRRYRGRRPTATGTRTADVIPVANASHATRSD